MGNVMALCCAQRRHELVIHEDDEMDLGAHHVISSEKQLEGDPSSRPVIPFADCLVGLDELNQTLPEAVIVHIFSFLTIEELATVSLVCRYWYRLSHQDPIWRHFYFKRWGPGWSQYAEEENNKSSKSWKALYRDKHELEAHYDYLFKVLLVGNAGTGKSGVLNRYVHQKFDQNTSATVAVDFTNRFTRLDVLDKITNRLTKLSIKVQVWDVGSRYYARSKERLCDKANGVMIVLDICDMSSLNQLGDYFSDIDTHCNQGTPVVLIGNKSDLKSNRQFSDVEVKDALFRLGREVQYFEVSCKTGENLDSAFNELLRAIYYKREEEDDYL